MCLPSLLVFTSLWSLHSYPACRSYRNHVKEISGNFKDLAKVGLAVLKKDRYFLAIPKWQYEHVQDYKWGKLVSYFLNNVPKTCLYGLKISENIDIEHVFQSKAFFVLITISTQVPSAPLNHHIEPNFDVSENCNNFMGMHIDKLMWKTHLCIIMRLQRLPLDSPRHM